MTTRVKADLFAYEFGPSTLRELSELLGKGFDKALPSLKLAAHFFSSGERFSHIPASVRKEVSNLIKLLEQIERGIDALSPEAKDLLHNTTNWDASASASQFVSVYYTLKRLASICAAARVSSEDALRRPLNSPALILATGVAAALADAEVPLSKGPGGTLVRVLEVMWHELAPDRGRADLFPEVKVVVDKMVAQNPALKARRGRPRK